MAQDIESRTDFETSHGTAKYWQIELELADKEEEDWRMEAYETVERYRNEQTTAYVGREKKFNILWSNVETLKSSLFSRMAKPDVRRRYRSRDDKAGREVSVILERALEYSADVYDAQSHIEAAIEDFLLGGRGVVFVSYDPIIIEVDGEETIGDQRCELEYVHWDDYRESPAKRPEDVRWKARRHLMTREELEGRFPDTGTDIPLNWSPDATTGKEYESTHSRAEVWEIWDKGEEKRVFVVKGYPKLVGEEETYNLEKFFPTPNALVAVRTNESGVPIPEYRLYRDQAEELDRISTRINRLIEALKRRGIYDAAVPELAKLADAGDNEFIPSENYTNLAQGGGLVNAFQSEDLGSTATALAGLYQQRDRLVQTIYEITGISDVIRGATNPNETATAQRLKGQFGSMRLQKRQRQVQNYIRDIMRIKAELIAENYEPHILEKMTGVTGADPMMRQQVQMMQQQGQPVPPELMKEANKPTWDEMIEIMRDDKTRSYHIDIETDSTIFEDAESEKAARMEFVNNLGQFIQNALPIVQAAPEMTAMVFESMEFMVRGFKIGRTFEDTIEETKEKILDAQEAAMLQQQQQEQQQMPPDPRILELQQKGQLEQAKLQQTGQMQAAKMQQEGQLKMTSMQQDAQMKAVEMQQDVQLKNAEMQQELAMRQGEMQQDMAMREMEMQTDAELEIRKQDIDAELEARKDQINAPRYMI